MIPEKLEEERKIMIFPSDSSGFGLIELLIVVAIIGIVAAAALLPLSGAKIAANGARIISYMRKWVPQVAPAQRVP